MQGRPAGHRVLIRPKKIEQTDETFKKAAEIGLDLSHTDEYKREQHGSIHGEVLQIGANAWLAFDNGDPWCEVGDNVLYGRFTGKTVIDPDTQEELIVVNDDDIIYVFGDQK